MVFGGPLPRPLPGAERGERVRGKSRRARKIFSVLSVALSVLSVIQMLRGRGQRGRIEAL
jgi:hypothetical protein